MRNNLKYVVGIFLASAIAFAGTIKVWGTNDVLSAADLNANFAHIHNLMVGGHGPRLVNADVASGAAIAYTKISTNPYIPTAWAGVSPNTCNPDGGTCTYSGLGISSVKHVAVDTFLVTFTVTPDVVFASAGYPVPIACTAQNGTNPALIYCDADPSSSNNLVFQAFNQ